MFKNKRMIYWTFMLVFIAVVTIFCGSTIVQSSRVSTINLVHQASYTVPDRIQVVVDEDNIDDSNADISTSYITMGMLLDTDCISLGTPTKDGYRFDGWKYSTDGENYTTYTSSTYLPVTEILYFKAFWTQQRVIADPVTITFNPLSYTISTAVVIYEEIDSVDVPVYVAHSTPASAESFYVEHGAKITLCAGEDYVGVSVVGLQIEEEEENEDCFAIGLIGMTSHRSGDWFYATNYSYTIRLIKNV